MNFNIALKLSVCHLNDTIENLSHNQFRKEILIRYLSDNFSLIQQLIILKSSNLIKNYFGIIF